MSLYDECVLSELDKKCREVLGDHVVVKSLAQHAALQRLPRYVSEYLIAKYVRPETWKDDLARVQTKIKDLLPDLERRELLKEKLLRFGEVTLIDAVEVRVDLRSGQRWARIPAINDDKVRVPAPITEQNPGLLLGGLWGTAKIRYSPEINAEAPNELVTFTPFQVGLPDVSDFRSARAKFTTDEWMCLLLHSAGYASQAFPSRRHRLLLLARLVPLVERNVNLIELGPRQTGKTFLLRNVSPRVFTMSGGKTTPANLFVNLATKSVGILGTRKVVVFDEIAHTSFSDEDATLSTLKDYMESGQFSRGAKSFATDASIVLTGNLDVDGDQPHPRYRHLFEALPEEMIDSALLDRIHGYLPGWEIPKITPQSMSTGVGFVSDYFGEVLIRMREEDCQAIIRSEEFAPGMTRRDQVAVERIGSGLVKLLFPDGKMTKEETQEIIGIACELRQRVHNQLVAIAPGEFKPRMISLSGKSEHDALDLRTVRKDLLPADDRLNTDAVVGAATGLGVIYSGEGVPIAGDTIIVQVSAYNGGSGVHITGVHGQVLKYSVETAHTIARTHCSEFGIPEQRFRDQVVAVHLVRIAEPKDGPSAGIAFIVGIVSALTNRAVKPGWAMTGEVTLHGEVLGVGGLPLKIVAAAKAGRKHIIVPAENAKEVAKVPEDVLSKVEIVPVRTIKEALDQVLEKPPA